MAGYIFALNNIESLKFCIENGIYGTNLSPPRNNRWLIHHEGTFADYFSMRAGDNIYFFIDRKIYGIGGLVNISQDCRYQNYIGSLRPTVQDYKTIKNSMLLNNNESNINNRLICLFEPSPYFFENGVDMDDVLASDPDSFRMLRAFWKLSFIKIDDRENRALKNIILKRNEKFLKKPNGKFTFNSTLHHDIEAKLNSRYDVDSHHILESAANGKLIRHEMAIEAGIIDIICSDNNSIFGKWDYISHQVIASPFKAIDYMDKMDIFGYRYIEGYDAISKYLVIEIKKDKANIDVIDQVMKYVDWINQEYTYGDYSMIEAFIVAADFPREVIDYRNSIGIRNFTKGRRPTISDTWKNIKLIKYVYNEEIKNLNFSEIE